MAVDKNKIIAEATRLVQKGQYDKALKAYEKVLAEDRKEVRVLLKVGEIQQKKGDNAAAAATFNQVAEIYGDQGFFLKAVAVYKQMAKLAPEDIRVNEKLASLYQQLGLLNDATNQLQVVATSHETAGEHGKHLDVLRRLLDLDPENILTCQRLGDLYAKANRGAEALELYRRAAAHLRENKRSDEYLKLAERIYQLTPDDLKLARELAQEYLARGDTKKALGKLQACHGADKQDVDTLRLMAQAFRDLGQVSKTIAVYRALARVYAERGRREESALTWRMVLDLLPDDPEASEELAAAGGPRAATTAPAAGRPPGAGPVAPLPQAKPAASPRPPPAPPPGIPRAPPPPATPVAPPAAVAPVARLLTETDVYVKYGLHKKALDHVQKILADDAENPDALERIRDIRDAMGDRAGAVEAADRVVRSLIARGEEGRIDKAIERLRQLDPALAEVALERVTAPPEAGTPASSGLEELPLRDGEPARRIEEAGAPAPETSAPGEIAPAIPVEPEADFVPLDIVAAESEFEAPPAQGPRGDLGPAPVVDDERAGLVLDDEVHSREVPLPPTEPEPALVLEDGAGLEPLPAAGEVAAAPALLEVEIPPLELEEAAAAEAAGPGSVQPQEVDLSDVEEIAADEALPEIPPAAPPPLPERGPPALDAELEEVEFYERHGLLEEALLAVRELEAAHPGHPVVEEARSRIERLAGLETGAGVPGEEGLEAAVEGAPDRSPPDAEPGRITLTPDAYASTGTTGIFDLGAELSAELGPDLTPTPTGEFQYSVADVFDQFKRGLEKTVRPDDSATKYDLGIAFQEMGMLDEALEQFRSALAGGDRRREVEILDMIGICLGLKGEHREAVETFRRALQSEFLTGDGAKAVHFELGVAHEALGEPETALWYYQKIAQGDPGYRGAGERVARLGGGPGTAPDDAGHPSPGSKAEATNAGGAEPRRHTTRKNAGSR